MYFASLCHVTQRLLSFLYIYVRNEISTCSFNVRGLGQKLKRTQIFTFFKSKKLQLCFLQETHLTKEIETTWAVDNTYDFYFSGRSSNSGSICIMVDKTLDYNVKEHTEIIPGKLQALRVKNV